MSVNFGILVKWCWWCDLENDSIVCSVRRQLRRAFLVA